jgi:rRNA-processing protein FCF1
VEGLSLRKKTIVCDANILIDYLNGGKDVLECLCKYSDFIVPDVIQDELEQLGLKDAGKIGIKVLDCPLDILIKAENQLPGCSFQDTVCFLLAFENNWVCATNDRKLRNECLNSKVEVIRGLGLLIELVKSDVITKKTAIFTAKKIAESNREITEKILSDFLGILD